MSAPKVLWESYLTVLNTTTSEFYGQFGIEGALNTLTYEFWRFDEDTAVVDIEYSGTVNAFGIVIDNLAGANVTLAYSINGVTYTDFHTQEFIEDGAVFFTFADQWANYFRITIDKAVASQAIVRNMMLGEYLEFERCLMKSYAPASYNRKTSFELNQSGTGEFLGRSSIRKGYETSYDFSMITSTWGRNQFQEFVENSITKAYYMTWNDELYPYEGIYGWTDEDIPLSYTGDESLMAANWSMRGIALTRTQVDINNTIMTEDNFFIITEDDSFIMQEA